MPFIATIHARPRPTSAAPHDYSTIQVPNKPSSHPHHPRANGATSAGGAPSSSSFFTAVPHISLTDSAALPPSTSTAFSPYDPNGALSVEGFGDVVVPDPHTLFSYSHSSSSSSQQQYHQQQQHLFGGIGGLPTGLLFEQHPHCGLAWAMEAADVAGTAVFFGDYSTSTLTLSSNRDDSSCVNGVSCGGGSKYTEADDTNTTCTCYSVPTTDGDHAGGTPIASFFETDNAAGLEGEEEDVGCAPNTTAVRNNTNANNNANNNANANNATDSTSSTCSDDDAPSATLVTPQHHINSNSSGVEEKKEEERQQGFEDRHLYPFVSFLRRYGPTVVHLLLKSARRSRFLSRNGDIRFTALFLLQQYTASLDSSSAPSSSSASSHQELGAPSCGGSSAAVHVALRGARSQAVVVAAALFLAAKFCDQNAQIRHVLGEGGLSAATVRAADVYDAEWELLRACGYQLQIPRYWQAACEVALSAPHEGMGVGTARNASGGGLSALTRQRIQHTALYMDRIIIEVSRNPSLQLAVLQMNADELALGCSIAVGASVASPTEATVALFDSVVVAPLNIDFQTLQAEALHEYVKCLGHLAGLLRTAADCAPPPKGAAVIACPNGNNYVCN